MGHHVVLHRRLQPRRDEPLEPLPPILPRRTTALRSARSDPHACSHAAFGMHPSATTPASRVSTFSSTSMTEGMVDDGLGDDAKAERRRGRRSSFPRQHGTNDGRGCRRGESGARGAAAFAADSTIGFVPAPSRDLLVRSSTDSSPRASGTFASFPIPPPPPPASASIEWGRFSMRPREVVERRRRWERPLLPQPEPPRVVVSFLSPRRRMTTTTRSL